MRTEYRRAASSRHDMAGWRGVDGRWLELVAAEDLLLRIVRVGGDRADDPMELLRRQVGGNLGDIKDVSAGGHLKGADEGLVGGAHQVACHLQGGSFVPDGIAEYVANLKPFDTVGLGDDVDQLGTPLGLVCDW